MRNLYYLAVEGPIGVGKTSLVKLLGKNLGAKMVLEEYENNLCLIKCVTPVTVKPSKKNVTLTVSKAVGRVL